MFAAFLCLIGLLSAAQAPATPAGSGGKPSPAATGAPDKAAPPSATAKLSAHGYELYSWQDDKKEWCFQLWQKLDRVRTREEVTLPRATFKGVDELKKHLYALADQETVSWLEFHPLGKGPRFDLPPQDIIDAVKQFATHHKLRLRLGKAEDEAAYQKQQENAAKHVPKADPAASAPKEFGLYSWLGEGETWRFAILENSTTARKGAEIRAAEVTPGGFDELKARLKKFASGAKVTWIPIAAKDDAKPDVPPEFATKMLEEYCKTIGATLKKP